MPLTSSSRTVALPVGVRPMMWPADVDREVPLPTILARIEQVHAIAGLGVDAREVGAFLEVALRATPGHQSADRDIGPTHARQHSYSSL